MNKLFYPAIFHQAEEIGFWVSFPDFPECFTDGDDIESAHARATEALRLAITSRKAERQEIPSASSVTDLASEDGTVTIIEF